MQSIYKIDQAIDELFRYREIGTDPAFRRFIPMVYDPINFDWREEFEPEFNHLFNGFMLKGAEEVGRIFLAVFPTDEVLTRFIEDSNPGDLLFMHHPLVMECGDPRGAWGKGFIPINPDLIAKMKEKRLSVFTLHVPLIKAVQQKGFGTQLLKRFSHKIVSQGKKSMINWVLKDNSKGICFTWREKDR
jgi:hypothetical protein